MEKGGKMIILSLDLSLNCTGYAVLDTDQRMKKKRIITYGNIYNKHLASDQIGLKLLHIEMFLKTLLVVFKPDVIIKEGLTGTGFGDSTKLARVHGILEKLTIGKTVIDINNKTFKKEFTGTGKAEKEDVANKCLEYIPNLIFRTDDESDSCGMAIYYTIQNNLCKW